MANNTSEIEKRLWGAADELRDMGERGSDLLQLYFCGEEI